MQNSIWKLVVLAGVVGIGFLAVLQAQNSLQNPAKQAGTGDKDPSSDDPANEPPQTELGASGDPELAASSFAADDATTPRPAEPLELADYSDNHHDTVDDGTDPFPIEHAEATTSAPYGVDGPTGLPDDLSQADAPRSEPGLDFRDGEPKFADSDPQAPDDGGPAADSIDSAPFDGSDPFSSPPPASGPDDDETLAQDTGEEEEGPATSEPDPYVRMSPQPEPDPAGAMETGPADPAHGDHEQPIEPAGFEDDDSEDRPSRTSDQLDYDADEPYVETDVDDLDRPTPLETTAPQGFDDPTGHGPEDARSAPDTSGPVVIGPADESDSGGDRASDPHDDTEDSFPPLGPFDPSDNGSLNNSGPATGPDSEAPTPAPAESGFDADPFEDDPFGGGMTRQEPNSQPAVDEVPRVGESDPGPNGDNDEPAGTPEPTTADPATAPEPFPSSDPFPAEATGDGDSPPASPATDPNAPNAPSPDNGEATTDDLHRDGDPTAPNPLEPAPDAAQLIPQQPDELLGDGTIDHDAPQGPQYPQLNVEKIAPQNAVIGQPLVYSIVVRNVGRVSAQQVVVEDRIPKGTQLKGTIPQAELTGKRLIWKLGTLQPNEHRKISIRVVPFTAGNVGSVATVNFVSEVASRTLITAPKLEVDVDGPDEVKLGDKVQLKFNVTNRGTGAAHGVVVRDLLPDGLKHPGGSDLEYEIGKLPAGETRQIKLQLTAAAVGQSVNHAIVTADGGITTEAKTPLEVYGTRLELSRSGPKRRYVGRAAVYTNVLENESSRPVQGVTVIEKIPSGMEFVEASSGGQFNEASGTVAWRVDQLEPQGKRVLRVKLVAKKTGVLTSVVKAIAAGGEEVTINSQTEIAGFAAIGVEIPEVASPVDVGETVTFRVVAQNRGSTAARNVTMHIEVPDELEVVTARGPSKHVVNGGTVQYTPISTIDGQTRAMYEITLRARRQGDARIRVQVEAEHLSQPLSREEAVLILGDAPPTAARQ